MGKYLDRTSRKTEQISLPTPEESSIEVRDNPIYQRLQVVLTYMLEKGNGLAGKQMTMRIITKIMNEALEDMRESGMHPDVMAFYIKQLSAMTYWIADGEWNSDIPIPEDLVLEKG